MKTPRRRLLLPLATAFVALAAWALVHRALGPDRAFLLPSPLQVARALIERGPELASGALATTEGALLGFGLAILVGVGSGLLLSVSPRLRWSLTPYLMILQMTPVIVLTPILILWVGPGLPSVTLITFLICFFPLAVNTTQGLVSTDRNLVDLFRMSGAGRLQEVFLLRLPGALPTVFAGLRISATLAPIAAITGDIYAGTSGGGRAGLGLLTVIYGAQFQMAALFAAAAVSCLMGFVFVGLVNLAARFALHGWRAGGGRPD